MSQAIREVIRERSRSRQKRSRLYKQKSQQQFQQSQSLIRSILRIEQNREQPCDKFVKILMIYKDKMKQDNNIQEIMQNPKKYMSTLNTQQLSQIISISKIQLHAQQRIKSQYISYWKYIIQLAKYVITKIKRQSNKYIKHQYKLKIKDMLNQKNVCQLQKLYHMVEIMTQNNPNDLFWNQVSNTIKGKLIEQQISKYYQRYKQQHGITQQQKLQGAITNEQYLQPPLIPFSQINSRLVITQQADALQRKQLAALIFKQEFQKARQKLQNNLSLPKNHNLMNTEIINQSTETYDFITQEIMEFEKYKRMESDQEDFDDWIAIETQGRFRDRKPQYINRVRVAFESNKYNQTHFDQNNPPPKTVQGYKFNIFYPDLFDKQKTPQYFLQPTESPQYCLIKFKAGPPYRDIAFRILRKQWEFSQKSGFQSIFAKGILHLYFNFKKPRYRI